VFADRADGLLFAGDHVLPTITPSIGSRCRRPAPARRLHGVADQGARRCPTCGSCRRTARSRRRRTPASTSCSAFHEHRLERSLAALAAAADRGAGRADLGWTRHEHAYDELDVFSQGMAAMETKAHLELLVARGQATRSEGADGVVTFAAARPVSPASR
jgi:hypothetical protein